MGLRVFFALVFLFSFVSQSKSEPLPIDFYSENIFSGREGVVTSAIRLRTDGVDTLLPYVTAGNELMTLGIGNYQIDGASYAYIGGGLRWKTGDFVVRAETRVRKGYAEATNGSFSRWDGRALLVYSFFSQRENLFLEPYSETLFTTADSFNFITANYVRGGIRWPLANRVSLDLFLEPYFTLDRVGHYYNNRADLKPSIRILASLTPVQLSLIASYVMNHYFSYAQAEVNPYTGKSSEGTRVLFVLGAQF